MNEFSLKQKMTPKYYYTVLSTMLIGFIAHGFLMMNKISNHDDVDGLKTGWNTYELGRWGMAIMNKICRTLFGSSVSVPWLIGIFSLIMLTLATIMVIKAFHIKIFSCAWQQEESLLHFLL